MTSVYFTDKCLSHKTVVALLAMAANLQFVAEETFREMDNSQSKHNINNNICLYSAIWDTLKVVLFIYLSHLAFHVIMLNHFLPTVLSVIKIHDSC